MSDDAHLIYSYQDLKFLLRRIENAVDASKLDRRYRTSSSSRAECAEIVVRADGFEAAISVWRSKERSPRLKPTRIAARGPSAGEAVIAVIEAIEDFAKIDALEAFIKGKPQ